jgi:hypothetical protein
VASWTELVKDPKQLALYLDQVDADLAQEGISIHARSFHAWSRLQRESGIIASFGDEMSQAISNFYSEKYGARSRMNTTIGRALVLLGHDAWALRFPFVAGTQKLDLLELLEDGTPGVVSRVTNEERALLESFVPAAFAAFNALKQVDPRVRADEATAVDQAVDPRGDLGYSRWSSQQTLEKLLGAFISRRGGTVPSGRALLKHPHELLPVVEAGEALGLPMLERSQLAKVECRAGTRYPRNRTTLKESVDANQASILICGAIAKAW